MRYICLPEPIQERHLSFYLAMEEYVARHLMDGGDLLFLWQVEPSVIFGRNQVVSNEVDIDYCRSHHIGMYRRKSGGGCVYADKGNVMFSYLTPDTNVNLVFHRFVSMLELVLRRAGVESTSTSHNDVLVGGRKVSGTAFFLLPASSIVHGTMLYDTKMEHMLAAITPSHAKLEKNGVQSVRQRIGLLKDFLDMSLEDFIVFARQTLCTDEMRLTTADIGAIEMLEQEYLSEEFIYQK